ncbi:Inositol-pentakisphosphate 2-kinase [Penicillium cosmopolitanum]|uniref:Inositol-pentakisphosphate 2-kinase n=1 Tax=Penicillium cosmopolitanum TaxID=1131564 RepID=A0A9W9WBU0_9EURO|nr:Inositol-pentakisphosphate 2-kinase [Penicillium cosmopolitanum]KAJ5414358.1 Inositol-pentakisphosphate 2-kinase [Penicillium cosmopolitanum]
MTKPSLLQLPPGVQLVYLAEGGANVIYRFVPSTSHLAVKKDDSKQLLSSSHDGGGVTVTTLTTIPPIFRGKLLRLRKQTASNINYKEIAANFNTKIRPLFHADELVDQTLIRLPDDLIPHCNQLLRAEERNGGSRPAKRHGSYLALNEPFGLLITDMTVFNDADPGARLAEFKPKWLLQSPSAPIGAERCRTCALREMKNREARGLGVKESRSFCPLDLVSERFDDVLRATAFVRGYDAGNDRDRDRVRLAEILFRNSTLRNLQSRQKTFREVGLLGPVEGSREDSLDMTLRDCTMFIKIPGNESEPVEIRLGDLDLKTGAGGKAQYWRDLERQLIDGGWYCTSSSDSSQKQSECALRSSRDEFNGNGNGVYST